MSSTKYILHRFGFIKPHYAIINKKKYFAEHQSFVQAIEILKRFSIDAIELDLNFTNDGVAVVTHKNISDLNFIQFKNKYPNHGTFVSWIKWLEKINYLKKSILYIDIKTIEKDKINCFQLIKYINANCTNPKNVFIGNRNINIVSNLILAKLILKSNVRISAQIPFPIFPQLSIYNLENKLRRRAHKLEALANYKIQNKFKADALHFFFIDNIFKNIRAETEDHDQYVQFTDWINYYFNPRRKEFNFKPHLIPDKIFGLYFKRSNGPQVYPNIFLLTDITLFILNRFLTLAKRKGYITFSGATNSNLTVKKLFDFGNIDFLMIEDPFYFDEILKKNKDETKFYIPKNRFLSDNQLFRGPISNEKNELEKQYVELINAINKH